MAPSYEYKAYLSNGKQTKGIIESESLKNARIKLIQQGLAVVAIAEKNASAQNPKPGSVSLFGGRVKGKDISLMTRQLASLIKANIPLVDALNGLVEQTETPRLRGILIQVKQDVNEGIGLSKAMAKHSQVFDHIFVNMVEAGESSGNLGLVLLRLADLKEAQMRLQSKVIGAMTYPILMLFFAIALMLGIFTFVIPQLALVFESTNRPMPASTQIIMQISQVITSYWYLFVGGIFFGVTTFLQYIRSPRGKWKWDSFKLNAPGMGPLIRAIAVSRFSNTMSTLLGSGVPILTSMAIAKNLTGNVWIEKAVSDARANIKEGQSIAEPLRRSGEFPPMVIQMISIGEKTGELAEMLKNVSDIYEEQVSAKIEGMTGLLEPLLIIMMGGIVGFMVLSVFVPLLEMNNIQ
jgi:general secretion pathway protein F